MATKNTSLGLLAICAVLAGCSSQNGETPAGSEDAGQFPDTTATEGNMILPSDDTETAPTTTATTGAEASATPASGI